MTDFNVKQELHLYNAIGLASNLLSKYKIKKLLPYESSFDILSLFDYFFVKKVSTSSGDIIASWKVYAPVFGDLTILIALVNLFDAVCNVATVFFAMTYIVLLETFN
jgi:hypothetical protein